MVGLSIIIKLVTLVIITDMVDCSVNNYTSWLH